MEEGCGGGNATQRRRKRGRRMTGVEGDVDKKNKENENNM